MNYRAFGQTNFKPSSLGFGLMRLPLVGNNSAEIDYPKAEEMVRFAIENGVNYFDTAYVYHQGQSEIFLGKILKKNHWREKIKIATKLPIWAIESEKDAEGLLEEELKRLQTDHIDFYLFHSLNQEKWQKVVKFDLISWAEKKKKEGKIKHLGFSFHDELSLFKQIIDTYDKWEFCLMQYNFMDENFQAGIKGLKYAVAKKLAVVIMEPLKGGRLATAPPSIQRIWDRAKIKRTPVEWALSWLWNQPEVSLVLSGMSSLQQVKENIQFANRAKTDMLTKAELDLFEEVKKEYQRLFPVPCTNCQYCLPCPKGVNIPKIFEIYNHACAYQNLEIEQNQYQNLSLEEKAENCISCGRCEPLCPQKIKIPEELKKVVKTLANNK